MADMKGYTYGKLVEFEPPTWATKLKGMPKHRVQLAMSDTPIHSWYEDLPDGFSIHIKRDDLTGSTLSGNKVRKLEFLFADAIKKGCSHVMTAGGQQSNHCRATAVAAAQLKMKCHLFLQSTMENVDDVSMRGNVLLNRMCGASMYMIPKTSLFDPDIKPRMEKLEQQILDKTGEKSYLVPIGGSNEIGMYGYLRAFQELVAQGVLENFDDIVFACGSGGTASGLSIGNYLTGSKLKIHAIVICKAAANYIEHINHVLKFVGLNDVKAEDMIDVIDGHKGVGYCMSTPEELEFFAKVAAETGIVLDPTYTGKAVRGMFAEMKNNPQRFKGKRVLFLHTGGIYGLYDGRVEDILKVPGNSTNRCFLWNDVTEMPNIY